MNPHQQRRLVRCVQDSRIFTGKLHSMTFQALAKIRGWGNADDAELSKGKETVRSHPDT